MLNGCLKYGLIRVVVTHLHFQKQFLYQVVSALEPIFRGFPSMVKYRKGLLPAKGRHIVSGRQEFLLREHVNLISKFLYDDLVCHGPLGRFNFKQGVLVFLGGFAVRAQVVLFAENALVPGAQDAELVLAA